MMKGSRTEVHAKSISTMQTKEDEWQEKYKDKVQVRENKCPSTWQKGHSGDSPSCFPLSSQLHLNTDEFQGSQILQISNCMN